MLQYKNHGILPNVYFAHIAAKNIKILTPSAEDVAAVDCDAEYSPTDNFDQESFDKIACNVFIQRFLGQIFLQRLKEED